MGKRKEDKAGASDAMASHRQGEKLYLRLIPEFDGTTEEISEWLDKAELVCELQGVTDLQRIVPLRLKGGAFAVYQQLTAEQKRSFDEIKRALLSAFAVDSDTQASSARSTSADDWTHP